MPTPISSARSSLYCGGQHRLADRPQWSVRSWSIGDARYADTLKIVNETVPLNGSRVYSASYGTTYPATAWFALFYLLSNGTIVNGPGSLGFNVSSNHPQDAGRLWSEDESDTSLSSPAEETSARAVRQPAATVTTSAVPSGGVQEASRLSDGAIAGIIVGIAMTLVAVFAAVLFLMRRRWKTTRTNREVPVVPPGIYEKEQPRTLPTEVDSRQLKSELPAEKAVNLISIPHPVVRN